MRQKYTFKIIHQIKKLNGKYIQKVLVLQRLIPFKWIRINAKIRVK